ncbi:MAG: Ig-like domain-containing protein [Eubacteriales bacterium]
MKRIVATGLSLMILAVSSMTVFAGSEVVSPGLNVLASNLTMYKTGISDQTLSFTPEEFEEAVGVSQIKSITILSLPDADSGALYLSSTPVMVNQVISRKFLSALTFVPNGSGEVECSFRFGVVSSSQPLAFECLVSLVPGLNFAPTVTLPDSGYLSASTLAGIPLYGRLTGEDPEGDSLTFRITTFPKNGTLTITNREAGEYVYTPLDGFAGTDSFGYVAIDAYGNRGKEVTVAVVVEKNTVPVSYCDLSGDPCELAAYRLAEKNLMVGQTIGGKTYFDPAGAMTRAEFLALVMCINGQELDYQADASTSFEDDGGIPAYLRAYVSRAEEAGWIEGTATSAGSYFFPNQTITLSEAAQMIAEVMDYQYTGAAEVFADEEGSVPAWAQDSLFALTAAGILSRDELALSENGLTRSDAAILLCKLLDQQ